MNTPQPIIFVNGPFNGQQFLPIDDRCPPVLYQDHGDHAAVYDLDLIKVNRKYHKQYTFRWLVQNDEHGIQNVM